MDSAINTRQRLEQILLQKDNRRVNNRSIDLDEINSIIHDTETYYLLHKHSISTGLNRIEEIRGDKLLSFLRDYIEPESGDGLDIDVFPVSMDWHLSFTIDGLIYYSSHSQQTSTSNKS